MLRFEGLGLGMESQGSHVRSLRAVVEIWRGAKSCLSMQ